MSLPAPSGASPAASASAPGSRLPSPQQPRVLLLDEPTSFLDVQHQVEVMALLSRLNAEGMTIVAVVHDLALAGRFMQRVIGMRDGRIAFDGPAREVLRPEPLEEVFGVPMVVLEDPESGLPVPLPRYPTTALPRGPGPTWTEAGRRPLPSRERRCRARRCRPAAGPT